MPTNLGELIYTLTLSNAGFEEKVAANKAQMKEMAATSEESSAASSGSFNKLGMAAAVVAVGIGVVADKTIKSAVAFQSSLTELVTGAGENQKNIGMINSGILKMATDTGTSTKQLTDGLYMIESAGYHGAAGLKVLQAAAEGAKVGNADLGTVADATTTIMKDFGGTLPTQAVNALIATVANGKTHMQDLAQALAMIAPTASASNISLKDMMGAMATMTGEGVPAANAATYLRQTIIGLEAPGTKAKKTLEDIGLSTKDVADGMKKSLPDTLAMITDHLSKKFPVGSADYIAALKDISGGSKTMQGMLDLTGQHMKDFQSNVAAVSKQVKDGGDKIIGWSEVQKDAKFQQDKFKESIQTAGIAIGESLLPALTAIAKALADFLRPIAEWVANNKRAATTIIEVVAALSVMVLGIVGVAKAIKIVRAALELLDANPIILIAMAIVAVAIIVVNNWATVKKFFEAFWKDVKQWFNDGVAVLKAVWEPIGDVISAVWDGIKDAIKAVLDWFSDTIKDVTKFIHDHKQALIDWAIVIGTILAPAIVAIGVQAGIAAGLAIAAAATSAASWVASAATSAYAWVTQTLPKIIAGFVTTAAQAVINAVKVSATFIAEAARTAIAWAITFAEFAAGMAIMVAQFLIQAARMAIGWLLAMGPIGAIVAIVAGIVALIIANWGTVEKFLDRMWNDIKGLFMDGINWIKNNWQILVAILLGPVGIILLAWHYFHDQIIGLFSSAINFIEGVWNSIVGFFGRIISSIVNAIRSGVSGFGSLLWNAGSDLINGLVHGIEGTAGKVFDAVKNIGSKAVNSLKGVLKIFSPSQVFSDLGANISLGLAQGITGTGQKAIDATANLATSVVQAGVSSPTSMISNNSSSSVGGNSYNFAPGSVILNSKDAVDEFFSIGNRSTALELQGGSPLAGTTGV